MATWPPSNLMPSSSPTEPADAVGHSDEPSAFRPPSLFGARLPSSTNLPPSPSTTLFPSAAADTASAFIQRNAAPSPGGLPTSAPTMPLFGFGSTDPAGLAFRHGNYPPQNDFAHDEGGDDGGDGDGDLIDSDANNNGHPESSRGRLPRTRQKQPTRSASVVTSSSTSTASSSTPSPSPTRRYELRAGARGPCRHVPMSWLDADDSGDYDPAAERRAEYARRRQQQQRQSRRRKDVEEDREEGEEQEDGGEERSRLVELQAEHMLEEIGRAGDAETNVDADADSTLQEKNDAEAKESREERRRRKQQTRRRRRATSPRVTLTDAAGHTGRTRTLTTHFAHPMLFNADSTPVPGDALAGSGGEAARVMRSIPTEACRFHTPPLFGLLGLGRRDVWTIRWRDGRGYSEVCGGWAEELGGSVTRMCTACTLGRVHVVGCGGGGVGGHVMVRMTDAPVVGDGGKEREKEITRALLERAVDLSMPGADGDWAGMLDEIAAWFCSVCVAPASWRCAREQEMDRWGRVLAEVDEEDEGGHRWGCGLRLCDTCRERLLGCGGDFQRMLRGMVREWEERQWERRERARAREERRREWEEQVRRRVAEGEEDKDLMREWVGIGKGMREGEEDGHEEDDDGIGELRADAQLLRWDGLLMRNVLAEV